VSAERAFWRRRLLPLFVLLLAANLVTAAAWTLPRGLRQRSAAARVADAQAEVKREREATARLRERAAAIRANDADVRRFYERLGGGERTELVPTLEAVESLARAPGLRPGTRTFREEGVKNAGLRRLAITLPLTGSYGQLLGFLQQVERSPRFLTVDGVSMRGESGGARLQVELSAYLKPAAGDSRQGRAGRGR